jgi:hypothetical protein
MIAGTGAGSTLPDLGTPWPVLKLLNEYGLLSSVSFCVLYLTGAVGAFNLPLKVALSLIFNFTGGYLLNPVMVELIAILFFITPPRDQLRFARVSGTRFLEAQQDRLA